MQAELLTYEKGDVNADGSVDTQDLFKMLYSCAKSSAGIREEPFACAGRNQARQGAAEPKDEKDGSAGCEVK